MSAHSLACSRIKANNQSDNGGKANQEANKHVNVSAASVRSLTSWMVAISSHSASLMSGCWQKADWIWKYMSEKGVHSVRMKVKLTLIQGSNSVGLTAEGA